MGKNISSGLDTYGQTYQSTLSIYRGIFKKTKNDFIKLYTSGLLQELQQKHLIPDFKISKKYNKIYPIILEIKKLSYTEPSYWSPSMLLDAGKTIIKVNQIAKKYGYKLIDSHPFNVMFDEGQAVFVDFGSFISADKCSCFEEEFLKGICAPLIMWKTNNSFWAQKLLRRGFYQKITPSEDILSTSMFKSCLNEFKQNNDSGLIDKLFLNKEITEEILEKLFKPKQAETFWKDYQHFLFEGKNEANTDRMKRYYTILKYVKRYTTSQSSIVDLAGNYGGMAYLITNTLDIQDAHSLDYDLGAIEAGYKLQKEKHSKVSLLLENFMVPANPNIYMNIKSDIVLAMAITHHLILAQNYTIDQIFSRIKAYSKKYVFIEFMPHGLWGGGELPPIPNWYTEEWFVENFKTYFVLLKRKKLEFNRILFIGKIKEEANPIEKLLQFTKKSRLPRKKTNLEINKSIDILPLLKITIKGLKKEYKLFGLMPILTVKQKNNQIKYKLFNFIPLLKRKLKK